MFILKNGKLGKYKMNEEGYGNNKDTTTTATSENSISFNRQLSLLIHGFFRNNPEVTFVWKPTKNLNLLNKVGLPVTT